MPTIKLKSIRFPEIKFRKLGNLQIPIAKRITIIAGHNGIGKSTILGLLANASGFSEKEYISYFNKAFQANLHDIIHLSIDHDFVEDVDQKPNVYIEYCIEDEHLTKRCNVTKRGSSGLRVVPRNEPKVDFSYSGIDISMDMKVPLPTLYLGMSRMIPIGESTPTDVQQSRDTSIVKEDRDYIHNLIHNLIDTGSATSKAVTQQSIKHTRKSSKHPDYPYDSRSVSLGQDSLSSIVTALASFKRLKREMGDTYPGGLLIIDEIDAGLHPSAQRDLIRLLQSQAENLWLQIIATSHSLAIIEKTLASSPSKALRNNAVDVVHYMQDTRRPHLCENWALDDIRADMYLDPGASPSRPTKPQVLVYTEDDEAKIVFDKIIFGPEKSKITRETQLRIKCLSIKMGCDDLMKLYRADKYFESVVIVLDADAKTGSVGNKENIVKLPGAAPKGERPTPELLIYRFLESLNANPDNHPESWAALDRLRCSTDYIRRSLLTPSVEISKREAAKQWFNEKLSLINRWRIIELWLAENTTLRDAFSHQFILAISAARRRQIALAKLRAV